MGVDKLTVIHNGKHYVLVIDELDILDRPRRHFEVCIIDRLSGAHAVLNFQIHLKNLDCICLAVARL